jgi:hypothetical protein
MRIELRDNRACQITEIPAHYPMAEPNLTEEEKKIASEIEKFRFSK